MKRVGRRLLSVTMALALVFTAVIPASAADFQKPTAPMDTQDNVIKTTATRAGQIAPLILGCNLVAGSNLGASQGDYNRVATILGVFGSAANDKPDPYLYNYNYNTYAAENNLPQVENATIATEQAEGGGSSDPNALMNATLTHKPDLCLTQRAGTGSNAEWEDYNAVIATYPENTDDDPTNDYKPGYYTCSISTLVYQCENLINLAKVVNGICEAKGLTTRYDKDPYEIATDYDKYVWGHYFYVQKMLAEKKIAKKKVAVVGSSQDNGATWQLPAVGTAVDQQKPNRLVEYVRDNTDLLNTTTAGTATLAEIMGCDVLIANGQGENIRSAASAAGIDEDDLPMIVEKLPACLYGMVMQTHENALGIPYIQSIIYGTDLELNPVYAAAYFYQNFFHISDEDALQETVNTLLGEASLPEGTTTSLKNYDPQDVEDIITQGIKYAKVNALKRHDDTVAWNPDLSLGIGSDLEPGSDHNYANNMDQTWVYTKDKAPNGVYVTFSEKTETESNYDYIYVMDGDDNQIGKFTGTELAGQTLYVPTSTVKIRLTSDNSSVRYGFEVTKVEAADDELIDLEKVGAVDAIAPVFVSETPNVVVRVNGSPLDSASYKVEVDTSAVGETTATITGTGNYKGTLEATVNVVDEEHLLTGAAVTEANIQLRQAGNTGSSYFGISDADSAWISAVESVTLKPVEKDGETATPTGDKTYPNAPKEITLTKDQLTLTTSRVSFERTAAEPVVYVLEGHDPIDIAGRWSTNTYPQSQKYSVTIKARCYEDTVGTVTYYTGTAPSFSIIVDADGSSSTTDDQTVVKSWTSDEIAEMAEFASGSSQCGMTGFRTFTGEGVALEDLLEDAGVEISDSDYFLLDTSDHYGNYFTYNDLFGVDRYFMSTIYGDEFKAFYKDLVENDSDSGGIIALRRYLAEHVTDADIVKPRINTNYIETSIAGSQLQDAVLPTEENSEFDPLVAYENQFRYFYGIKLVQDDCTLSFDSQGGSEVDAQLVKSHTMTATENTTMKSSYWANSLVIYRGAGEDHKTEPSEAANTIVRPADPSRVGYTFEGWYTDPECTEGNEFDFTANDKKIDENTTLYAKWSKGATLPESDHTYGNSTDRTYSYDLGEEAAPNGIVVKFNEQTKTEGGYDFITIMDAEGNELGRYSGTELAGKSVYVPTSKVQIRLTSDRSADDWGFKVDSIEPNGETIDLGQFGVIGKIDAVQVNGTPEFTVSVNGQELTKDTDYTVAYDTSAAGVKAVTVTGTGAYSGTLSKDFVVYTEAVKITDYTITSAEHNDEDGELNQTIIATITFDKEVKMTAEDLKDELNITIAGGNAYSTARDITFKAEGNQLIITFVSNDWVAIYNGVLTISESDNNLTHLTGITEGSAVVWETQSDNIPIGIVVVNDPTPGTADTPATTDVEITHKANMRGMYHFELVSIAEDGTETVINRGTSHAHAFYTSITKESIAKAISTFVNNQEGYTAVYNDGTATFTMTADEPVSGQKIAIRMFENKAHINYLNLPESEHEYQNNTDQTWSFDLGEGNAPNGIIVKFNEQTMTEKGYDFITIMDAEGNELGRYSGDALAGRSVYVPTSMVQIRLTSDQMQTAWGFKVDSIEPNGETIDLGQFGEIGKIDSVQVNGTPDITVSVNGEELTAGTDYTAAFDTSNAGESEVTVTGTGKYSGTLSKAFTVYDGLPESAHNYGNSTDEAWTYDVGDAAANGIVVKFNEQTKTEGGYDFITIMDAEGNELGRYSGDELAGRSVYVPTSKVRIRLTSDRMTDDWGFKVDSIEPNGETIDLGQFGEIGKIDAVQVNGTPELTVTVNGQELVKDTDYTVAFDTSSAGVKPATVTGIGSYSGTLSKDFVVYTEAVRITDYTITSAEHNDEDGELNQTIIATITFDKDVKMTADTLKDELNITITGGDAYATARDITFKAEGNQLVITFVSTDWVAIYNGVLAISESDKNLTHLTGMEEGSAVVWETQSDNIPIGIVVMNDVTTGTADAAATTNVEVTHKANMRGMYHFQLVSIVGGKETVIAQGTSHAHAFYTTITKESIAKAIATFVNNQEGYTAIYNDGTATFSITADEAVPGQILAVRMFENKAKINYVNQPLPESLHEYENNTDAYFSYTCPEAENGVVVTFSEETKTEAGYDFITILDANNNELGKYSGTELAGKSVYVPTSTVNIHFTSDRSGVDYGFKVVSVEPNGETIDLSKFGVIGKIDAVQVNGTPELSVTVNGQELVKDTDYTVAYDTSSAGLKTATVTGIGGYTGTLSKDFVVYTEAVKITDMTLKTVEHNDEDAELNQIVVAEITFDKDVKMTADTLKDELNITIGGGNAYNTARDFTFKAEGNKLTITMVSTDWVAIYNGICVISESDKNLTHLTGTTEGSAVVWETQTDRIPTGIVVVNDPTAGTAETPASTVAEVTHKSNVRAMYHFELVSIVNGEETVVGSATSHAHNFYGSITKETIANAMASFVNKQEGYSAEIEEGSASFTIKADQPVEGQTLALRMIECKAQINYKADIEAAAAAEALIDAIGDVTENSGDAIAAARTAYDALNDAAKDKVSDEAKAALEAAEEAYAGIQKAKADAAAAAAAEQAINDIGAVTLDSKAKIDAAKAAFDALTDDQKALVSDAAKKALADAEQAYNDQVQAKADADAAAAAEKAINDIGKVTKDSGSAIKAARDAYNALTDAQKALVSADAVKALENAEAAYDALQNNKFVDVPDNAYYAEAVAWAVANDVTKGTSETTFSPTQECTRGQMVTFLYRAAGSPAVTSQNNPFTDVQAGKYYYDAVLWAVEKGITKGMTDTTFGPDEQVSRGQAVTFLFRLDGGQKVTAANPFTDVSSSAFYYDAVLWAVDKGITNGITATTFEPGTTCQRAHIVTFLYRYLG